MRVSRLVPLVAIAGLAAGGAWVLVTGRLPWPASAPADTPAAEASRAATETRRIRATLFFVAPDGTRLVRVQREVPFGDGPAAQAERLLEAALGPAPPPYLSPVPSGTHLRAVFVTGRGDAFVDLSGEVRSAHPGGSLAELLTVYAVVNTLTANLPAVTAVQVLVDGREVDTLAGHVDLRHPLRQNLRLVVSPETTTPPDEIHRFSG